MGGRVRKTWSWRLAIAVVFVAFVAPVAYTQEGASPPTVSASSSGSLPRIDLSLVEISPRPLKLNSRGVGIVIVSPVPASGFDHSFEQQLTSRFSLLLDGTTRLPVSADRVTSGDNGKALLSFSFEIPSSAVPSFFNIPLDANHTLTVVIDADPPIRSDSQIIEIDRDYSLVVAAFAVTMMALVALIYLRYRRIILSRSYPRAASSIGPAENRDSFNLPLTASPPELTAPPRLMVALSEQRVVLVLGDGASLLAGFPVGWHLLGLLRGTLGRHLPASVLRAIDRSDANGDPLGDYAELRRVLDAVVASAPRGSIIDAVRAQLFGVRPDPAFHQKLAGIPWRSVISLCWDRYADAVVGKGPEDSSLFGRFSSSQADADLQKVLTLEDSADIPTLLRSGNALFLKPFGDFDNPTSFSMTMEEFRRNLQRWPEFQRQVSLLMRSNSFLFVGVPGGMVEQFLYAITPDVLDGQQLHFALLTADNENQLLAPTLSQFGVQVLSYREHEEQRGFVAELAQESRKWRGSRTEVKEGFDRARIESIRLRNIGVFDHLEIAFENFAGIGHETVPWSVIFGRNGTGKSTILRALAVAFMGNEAPETAKRLLKTGKNEGEIEVKFGSVVMKMTLVKDRGQVLVKTGATTPVQGGLALVLGFPVLRGAPTPNPRGPATITSVGPNPADLMPLATGEVDKRFATFKQWVINILEQSNNNRKRGILLKALLDNIIAEIVPGRFKKLAPLDETYVIKVKTDDSDEPSPTDIPFDDISQGMASIFNWLGVLAQRLCDFYPDSMTPQKEHAVILIDEIDAHLHPDWQRRIVELTKRFFPKVQVIASSHSPLLAGALHANEIIVLEVDPTTMSVAPLDVRIELYGQRPQTILTSPIFGLESDRNMKIAERIKRHAELLGRADPNDSEVRERLQLEIELEPYGYAGARPATDVEEIDLDKVRHFMEERIGVASAETGETNA